MRLCFSPSWIWSSEGFAVKNAREYLDSVSFFSLGGDPALPRTSPVEFVLYVLGGYLKSCGTAVNNHSQC